MSEPAIILHVECGPARRADALVGERFPGASRRRIAELFAAGAVRMNGRTIKKGALVAAGSTIELSRPPTIDSDLRPVAQPLALEILFEDQWLVAVAKPAGMACHPLAAGERDTVANALVHAYPECALVGDDPREAGLAHRLDRFTTGVLMACRDRDTWSRVRRTFAKGRVHKSYLAVVVGAAGAGESSAPLLQRGPRVVISDDGLAAHSSWTALARGPEHTILRVEAHTGRMHQVRAHLAASGYPIVGDPRYGTGAAPGLDGYFLHAEAMRLPHPTTGDDLELRCPLPPARMIWLRAVGISANL